MSANTPRNLFFAQLRDLLSAEAQLATALPALAARGTHPRLAGLIARHADETRRQLDIITSIFKTNDITMGDEPCKTMEGLITEGYAHLDEVEDPETRDLMMIAHCLRIEHYEIAAYGITLRLAEQLGFEREATLLEAILREEEREAEGLTKLEPLIFARAVHRRAS